MEKQEKVIDASIVVKWFLNEKDSDKARLIRSELEKGDISVIVPELLFLEILNALKYNKVREKNIIAANRILFGINFKVERLSEGLLFRSIENSVKYDLTIYDAIYVTLAQIYGTFLITADKELYNVPNVIALEKI